MSNDKKNHVEPTVTLSVSELSKMVADGISKGMTDAAIATEIAKRQLNTGAAKTIQPTCPDCRQPNMACKGKHTKLAVFPNNPRYGRWFQGIRINGVLYLSNSKAHQILVPESSDIVRMIEDWERNEEATTQGRQAEHNSGVLSGQGRSSTKAAQQGWR